VNWGNGSPMGGEIARVGEFLTGEEFETGRSSKRWGETQQTQNREGDAVSRREVEPTCNRRRRKKRRECRKKS